MEYTRFLSVTLGHTIYKYHQKWCADESKNNIDKSYLWKKKKTNSDSDDNITNICIQMLQIFIWNSNLINLKLKCKLVTLIRKKEEECFGMKTIRQL